MCLNSSAIVNSRSYPNYQRKVYGKRAMRLLRDYYEGQFTDLNENVTADTSATAGIEEIEENDVGLLKEKITPRRKIPTLLRRLNERPPENIDYLGTSYGLTQELLKFWKNMGFVPVYISQKANDLTGEHSCIMLHTLNKSSHKEKASTEWLSLYFNDFRRRIIKLLGKTFREFSTSLALSIIDNKTAKVEHKDLTKGTLDVYFLPHDIQRLESYSRNQIEYRLILDLVSDVSYLYFQGKINGLQIDTLQKAILLAIGVQGKTVDTIAGELKMPGNQVLAKFYDLLKKATKYFLNVIEGHIEDTMVSETQLNRGEELVPITLSLNDELGETANELTKQQKAELKKLKMENLKDFAIKGTDDDWSKALTSTAGKNKLISVKSGIKRLEDAAVDTESKEQQPKKKKMKFGKKSKGLGKSLI